ncbi:hypothetical protein BLNAU_5877 [Blattamonas nauphoetae]|uniref:Uncharacterized protein n=1 Tax=Blattamonas nauphoetae TaxID=2049346 RepID=A0ABQ9Y5Q5_9EUKA|nr:hypothetical protein BLNAU_5877 [Blattamonas nauphoetae]
MSTDLNSTDDFIDTSMTEQINSLNDLLMQLPDPPRDPEQNNIFQQKCLACCSFLKYYFSRDPFVVEDLPIERNSSFNLLLRCIYAGYSLNIIPLSLYVPFLTPLLPNMVRCSKFISSGPPGTTITSLFCSLSHHLPDFYIFLHSAAFPLALASRMQDLEFVEAQDLCVLHASVVFNRMQQQGIHMRLVIDDANLYYRDIVVEMLHHHRFSVRFSASSLINRISVANVPLKA